MLDLEHAKLYPVEKLRQEIETLRSNVTTQEWAIKENNAEIDNMLGLRDQFDTDAIDADVARRRERNQKHAWEIVQLNKGIMQLEAIVAAKEAVR